MILLTRTLCLIALFAFLSVVACKDLHVGSSFNNVLTFSEYVKLSAVPLKTRTKNVFYNSEELKIIKGVSAVDKGKSEASATITSGGVGSTFVNVKLKSERGDALEYQVQVFV